MSEIEKNTVTKTEKLSIEQIAEAVHKEVDTATVLDDGSIHLLSSNLAENVVRKKYLKLNSAEINGFVIIPMMGVSVLSFSIPMLISSDLFLISIASFIGSFITGFGIDSYIYKKDKKKVENLLALSSTGVLRSKIAQWLNDQYDVQVSPDVLEKIARNSLIYYYTEFVGLDKKQYRFNRGSESGKKGWFLEEVKTPPKTEIYFPIVTKMEQASGKGVMSEQLENQEVVSAEHQMLLDKLIVLKKQVLTSEQNHIVDRAQQEAYSIVNSSKILVQLGDNSHEDNVAEAFNALNEELDSVLASILNHQRNELVVKKQLIKDRTRKPILLVKE